MCYAVGCINGDCGEIGSPKPEGGVEGVNLSIKVSLSAEVIANRYALRKSVSLHSCHYAGHNEKNADYKLLNHAQNQNRKLRQRSNHKLPPPLL